MTNPIEAESIAWRLRRQADIINGPEAITDHAALIDATLLTEAADALVTQHYRIAQLESDSAWLTGCILAMSEVGDARAAFYDDLNWMSGTTGLRDDRTVVGDSVATPEPNSWEEAVGALAALSALFETADNAEDFVAKAGRVLADAAQGETGRVAVVLPRSTTAWIAKHGDQGARDLSDDVVRACREVA